MAGVGGLDGGGPMFGAPGRWVGSAEGVGLEVLGRD
jgi:hypothetical protein